MLLFYQAQLQGTTCRYQIQIFYDFARWRKVTIDAYMYLYYIGIFPILDFWCVVVVFDTELLRLCLFINWIIMLCLVGF